MRLQPTLEFLSAVRKRWEAAAREGRDVQKAVIEEACRQFVPAYSYCQMTRKLKLRARKRAANAQTQERLSEIASYAEKVWQFKILADYDQKTFTIRKAFSALRKSGQVPNDITMKQIYASIERLHLRNISESVAAKHRGGNNPFDEFQVDYSKSEYFHFNAKGQIFISPPTYTKKNESRIMIACAVDYASRVRWFQYFFVEGENAGFVRDAVLAAFEEKQATDTATGEITGSRHILQGIPKNIYWDRGSGNAAGETAEGLRRLGIRGIKGANQKDSLGRKTNKSNKKGRGVVEKAIGDFKRDFEADLWARHLLGDLAPDFTLRELNEWVMTWCENLNNSSHPILDGQTRWEIFAGSLATAKFPPDEARMYFTGNLMVTVIGRLVRLSKTKIFIAPDFANDGDRIEVIPSGRDCYCYHNGEMIKLKPQEGSMREMIEQETGSETYEGQALRERLADELDVLSGGELTIRSVKEILPDDIAEFFEKARSVEEIKSKAAYFAIAQRPGRAANIIEFQEVIK